MHGVGLVLHFYRDRIDPGDRRSPFEEVDFVAERTDGAVLPIEVKLRSRIRGEDVAATRRFVERYHAPLGLVITRETFADQGDILELPLRDFLLAF
jgi:predicted AAA+ superfamily ATPase